VTKRLAATAAPRPLEAYAAAALALAKFGPPARG
jgi:hypothetical protein